MGKVIAFACGMGFLAAIVAISWAAEQLREHAEEFCTFRGYEVYETGHTFYACVDPRTGQLFAISK